MHLGQWIGLLAFVISLYILWQIRPVIFLAFLAIIIATALNRFVRRLQRSGVKRGIAIAVALGVSLAVLFFAIAVMIPPLIQQFQQLIALLPEAIEKLQVWFDSLQTRFPQPWLEQIDTVRGLTNYLQPTFTGVVGGLYTLVSSSLEFFISSVLVVVLTVMFLVNPKPYRQAFIHIFPAFYRQRIDEIISQCEDSLIGWLTGIFASMTFIAVTSGIGLWILQVPLALVNALLAGFLALIPYVGAILSAIPAMAIAGLDAPWKAVAVLVLYFIIQQIEGNFVTPLIMEKKVSLLPAFTLAIMTVFGLFFGLLGLFLSLPIIVVIQICLKEILIKDVLNNLHKPEDINSL